MARLLTWGFEHGGLSGDPNPEGQTSGAAPTVVTSTKRSGSYSLKCDPGSVTNQTSYILRGQANDAVVGAVAGTTYYWRSHVCFANLPGSTTITILRFGQSASTLAVSARLTSGGKLQLWNDSGTPAQIGSNSAATIAADGSTWYRVELMTTLNATPQISAVELRLDGVSVASGSPNIGVTAASCLWSAGWTTGAGSGVADPKVCYLDDCAINNSSGAAQNSWPGDGKVVMLIPTADNAVGTGWTLGTGTAISGNAYDSVNNQIPLGVADLAAGSDPKQIRNAASSANSSYDATMTTYTAAGIGASDTINVITPVVITAAPVTTGAKAGTVGMVSNPVIANVALGAEGVAGAFWGRFAAFTWGLAGCGWKSSTGTATHGPSVTLGTAPVMRVTQVTASTRIAMVCFMGIYVDYTPAAAPAATKKTRALVTPGVTVMRAAAR